MEIGTVDSMQGREKDAVIISLVRSNDKVCGGTSTEGVLDLTTYHSEVSVF